MSCSNEVSDELCRIAARACWPMIRGYSARDLGPGSAALQPSSSEPKAVPWSVTDAPGGSRVCRVTAQLQRTPRVLEHLNDRLVPKSAAAMVGRTAHHSGTAVPGAPTHRPACNAPVMRPRERRFAPSAVRGRRAGRPPSAGRGGTGLPSGPSARRPQSRARSPGPVIASSRSRLPPPEPITPWPLQPPFSHSPSTGVGADERPVIGRVLVLAGLEHPVRRRAPRRRPRTARRGRRASAEAGSRRRNAKSADVGTLQAGSLGAVSGSVSRT